MPYEGEGIYRHYKGGLYEVLGLALQEDDLNRTYVIYRPLSPTSMLDDRPEEFWARELGDFNEQVEDVAWKDATMPRFTKLTMTEIMETRNDRLLQWAWHQVHAECRKHT